MPRESSLHQLDARAKLLAALCVAAATVVATRPGAQAVVAAVLLAGFAAARLPVALVWAGIRGALWIVLFVVLANVGWSLIVAHRGATGGEAAIRTPQALAALVTRLFNLVLLAALVTATTLPVEAAEAVDRLLRPLGRLRIPVHEVGLLLVLTLSFVPLFLREARALSDAHRVKRGQARWRLLDRARALVPLTLPLFLAVVRRADELAVAMDARGFVPGAARTGFTIARFRLRECAIVTVSLLLLGACAWR